jgi:hypothetical protein
MNNQSEPTLYPGARPRKLSRPRGNWQLMLVNEYGRTVRIHHPRRYLLMLGGLVLLLLITALCFAGLFVYERSTRQELQASVAHIQETVSALTNENDALTARLAVLYEKGESAGVAPAADSKDETPAKTPEQGPGDVVAQPSAADPGKK